MDRRSLFAGLLVASLAAAPVLAADDTLTGTLVSVEQDGQLFTIQTAEGKHHTFRAPSTIDLRQVEPGTELRVKAQPITEVARDQRRQATAVAVLGRDEEKKSEGAGSMPRDPATGGAPGGGPPSGGIPGGGVPSGGGSTGSQLPNLQGGRVAP